MTEVTSDVKQEAREKMGGEAIFASRLEFCSATLKVAIRNSKFAILVAAMLLALGFPAEAQQPARVPRIGYLTASGSIPEGLREGLRELGYLEGNNIIIEWRSAEGKVDRISALAAELVRLKVDLIVTGGSTNTRAAKEATATIPIIMLQDPDPVGNRFVASLARPGGNITGFSSLTADLSGKRLELLKEIIPKLSRVAVLGSSTNRGNAQQLRETERAAGALGVQLQFLDLLGPKDVETAFRAAGKWMAQSVLVLRGPVTNNQRTKIVEFEVKSRLPTTYPQSESDELCGKLCRLAATRRNVRG